MGNSPSQPASEPTEEEQPDGLKSLLTRMKAGLMIWTDFNLDQIKGDSELSSQDETESRETKMTFRQKIRAKNKPRSSENKDVGVRQSHLHRSGSLEKYGVYASSDDSESDSDVENVSNDHDVGDTGKAVKDEESGEVGIEIKKEGKHGEEIETNYQAEEDEKDGKENKAESTQSDSSESTSLTSPSPQMRATTTRHVSHSSSQSLPIDLDSDSEDKDGDVGHSINKGAIFRKTSNEFENNMTMAPEDDAEETGEDTNKDGKIGSNDEDFEQLQRAEVQDNIFSTLPTEIESSQHASKSPKKIRPQRTARSATTNGRRDMVTDVFVSQDLSDKAKTSRTSTSMKSLKRKRDVAPKQISEKPPKKQKRIDFPSMAKSNENSKLPEKVNHPTLQHLQREHSSNEEVGGPDNFQMVGSSSRKTKPPIANQYLSSSQSGEEPTPRGIATSVAKRTFSTPRSGNNNRITRDSALKSSYSNMEIQNSHHDTESDYDFPADDEDEEEEEEEGEYETFKDDDSKDCKYVCKLCQRGFGKKSTFLGHPNCSSIKKSSNACFSCSKTFTSIRELAEHQQKTGHGDGTGYDGQKGQFTADEVDQLQRYRDRFCAEHDIDHFYFNSMMTDSCRRGSGFTWIYKFITKSEFLNEYYDVLPHRNRRSMHRYRERHFQNTASNKDWSQEDDEQLVQLVRQLGPKWIEIGQMMNRTQDAVNQRWRNRLKYGDKRGKGKWTSQETKLLSEAIERVKGKIKPTFNSDDGISWSEVSKEMNDTRTAQQCSNHWRFLSRKSSPKQVGRKTNHQPRRRSTEPIITSEQEKIARRDTTFSTQTTPKSMAHGLAEAIGQGQSEENALLQSTSSGNVESRTLTPGFKNSVPVRSPRKPLSLSQIFGSTQANTSALKVSQAIPPIPYSQQSDRPSPEIEMRLRVEGDDIGNGEGDDREEIEEIRDVLSVSTDSNESSSSSGSETDSDESGSADFNSGRSSLVSSNFKDLRTNKTKVENEEVGIREGMEETSSDDSTSTSGSTSTTGSDSDQDENMVFDTKNDYFMASVQAMAKKGIESSQKQINRGQTLARVEVDDSEDED